jgi:hypothetical protein
MEPCKSNALYVDMKQVFHFISVSLLTIVGSYVLKIHMHLST